MHHHLSFTREMRDQVGILRSHSRGRNLWRIVRITQRACVRQTIVGAARGSIERRDRSESRRCAGADAAVNYCLAIGLTGESIVGESLIKPGIEQDYLPCYTATTERLQLFEVIYDHNFSGQTFAWSR